MKVLPATAKYHERANCRESFTTVRKLKRFVIMKSNFMPMQLQTWGIVARSAHGTMYLRFNACMRPWLQSVLDLHLLVCCERWFGTSKITGTPMHFLIDCTLTLCRFVYFYKCTCVA